MIDNITKGDRIQGLLVYLFGPGKDEEHIEPRLVAGWDGLASPQAGLKAAEVFALASEMDRPRQLHHVDDVANYVWHCSLRNHDGDRTLTDAEWGSIAREVIEEMGFAECRWVAVRHADNHVHLAVTRVTEAGKLVNLRNDFKRMKAVCARLEVAWSMQHTPDRARGIPGASRAELERAARAGHTETARDGLARKLRAVAAVARSESEFVTRARQDGLELKARRDETGTVTGYAVSDPSATDGLWYAGRTLAPDLSLPRLRHRWGAIAAPAPQPATTPQGDRADGATVPEPDWPPSTEPATVTGSPGTADRESTTGAPAPVPPPRQPLRAEAWQQARAVVDDVHARLQAIPASDTTAWAQAAGEVAGVLAVLSGRLEQPGRPGPLARSATAMARAAQTDHMPNHEYPTPLRTLWGVSRVSADAILNTGGVTSMAALMRSVEGLVDTIHETHRLEARAAQARQTAQAYAALRQWATNPIGPMPAEAAAVLPAAHTRQILPSPPQNQPPAPGRDWTTGLSCDRSSDRVRKLFGRRGDDGRSR